MLDTLRSKIEPILEESGETLRRYFSKRDALPQAELKSDESPVTIADRAANDIIVTRLSQTYPQIPVISEESEMPSPATRRTWNTVFLVDPLDGTKEFIRGSPDFAINIALIEKGVPVWGAIFAPIHGITVCGGPSVGAHSKRGNSSDWLPLSEKLPSMAHGLRAVMSQGHTNPYESPIAKALPLRQIERFGSSFKFVKLALGEADIFFRKTPTSEWDTASGHALLGALGYRLVNFNGEDFLYNVRNTLLNGEFLCAHKSIVETCLQKLHSAGFRI